MYSWRRRAASFAARDSAISTSGLIRMRLFPNVRARLRAQAYWTRFLRGASPRRSFFRRPSPSGKRSGSARRASLEVPDAERADVRRHLRRAGHEAELLAHEQADEGGGERPGSSGCGAPARSRPRARWSYLGPRGAMAASMSGRPGPEARCEADLRAVFLGQARAPRGGGGGTPGWGPRRSYSSIAMAGGGGARATTSPRA